MSEYIHQARSLNYPMYNLGGLSIGSIWVAAFDNTDSKSDFV
jgi:hypothetical protein